MSILGYLFGERNNVGSVEVLEKEDFRKAITKKGTQLVDVRTPREFNLGHLKGAQNIDYFNPFNFKKSLAKMDKDRPVYLYCQSGNRSLKAARKLMAMGFKKIYDLRGGYGQWS